MRHLRSGRFREGGDDDRRDDEQRRNVGAGCGPGPRARRPDEPAAEDGGGVTAAARRGSRAGLTLARGAATLSGWRDEFLAGGEAALATKPTDAKALEAERLKAKLGELMLERELLAEKIARLEAGGALARRRSRR